MKKKYTPIALLLAFQAYNSQTATSENTSIPNIFPPKASVMPMFRMEQIPVNLSTGIPDISHNLLSTPIDNTLFYNFKISYHPSQVRVEEIGSELGVGWSTSDLGIITRTVNGVNDDKSLWGILDNQVMMPGNNFDGTIYANSSEWLKKRVYESLYSGQYDILSDEYMFSFLGNSGKFVFIFEDGAIKPKILGTEKKFKIQYGRDAANGHFTSFSITDDKGYQYIFDLYESDTNTISSTSVSQINQSGNMPVLPQTEYKNNWHLTKIKAPSGNEVLSAQYEMYNFPDSETRSTEYNHIIDQNVKDYYKYKVQQLNHLDYLQPLYKMDVITKNNNTYKLKQINIPDRAVIYYDKVTVNGQDFLDKIRLFDAHNRLINSYKFNIIPSGSKSVLSGVVNEQDNKFNYSFHYNGVLADADSKEKDNWGYYNNNFYTDWFDVEQSMEYPYGADKNTNPLAILNGSLRYEVTPTKGVAEYVWEPNTFSQIANSTIEYYDIPENRTFMSNTFNKTAFNNEPSDEIIYVNTPQKIIVNFTATQYTKIEDTKKYTLQITPVKYDQPFDPDVFTPTPANCYEETSANTSGVIRSKQYITLTSGTSAQLTFFGQGLYKVSLVHTTQDLQYNQVQYNIEINKYKLTDTKKYLYGGGLRIKQINFWDSTSNMNSTPSSQPKRYFQYFYNDFADASRSSGVLNNKPVYSYTRTVNESENSVCPTGMMNYDKRTVNYGGVQYKTYSNNAVVQTANLNGSFVTYGNVKVIESEGYTNNYFTTPLDFNNDYDVLNYSYPFLPAKNPEKKYGLIKRSEIYNSSNVLQRRDEYTYTIVEPDIFIGAKAYIPGNGGCFVKNSAYSGFMNSYEGYLSITGNHNFNVGGVCGLFGGCGGFDSVVDSKPVYKKNVVPLLQQKTVKEYHPGGIAEQSTTYEYNSNYNIYKETSQKTDLSVQETTFRYAFEKNNQKLLNANIVSVPLETSVVRKRSPSAASGNLISKSETKYDDASHLFPTSVASYDILNGNAVTQVTFDKYDSKGNLQQYTTKDGIPTAIIWGYNTTLPIAKIEGAQYDAIKNNSLITAIVSASDSDAGNPSLEPNLITALDNLRNDAYFKDFQMATYTYDPLVGVTSLTPPSGVRELYIYNTTTKRLEKIIDEQGKTLKEFKYNYKN
ncbi:hypothetical protein [Chryseobacterium gambrini]|uniref:hypothetical protein n=1 Tax=Chryseobacterium gambrini TaxID=373672 RepID=UPI003BA5FB0E